MSACMIESQCDPSMGEFQAPAGVTGKILAEQGCLRGWPCVCVCVHMHALFGSKVLFHFLFLINHNTHVIMQKSFLLLSVSSKGEGSTQAWFSTIARKDLLLFP